MEVYLEIISVKGREILDSRGNPTVEAEVCIKNHITGETVSACAKVPSGASTGQYEAVELRDKEERYQGKGVKKAVKYINEEIATALYGQNALKQYRIDEIMVGRDATPNKSRFGANAILSVSLANAQVAAKALKMPLYRYLGGANANIFPVPMMNIINGGAHAASSGLDVQEFMIMPVGACCFQEALRYCVEVYHVLANRLRQKGYAVSVGDEGGFAPAISSDEQAIEEILGAITEAGYRPYQDFVLALDVAASEWRIRDKATDGEVRYRLPKEQKEYTSDELITHFEALVEKYPIFSIEDPLDEEDWEGWSKITQKLGNKIQLVGDDLFVTNTKRLMKGIEKGCANAILIKPNQIGSLTETLEAIAMAKKAGYATIISHRSGETEDTTIADLAVAVGAGQIKTGAPNRSERVAKYNRLLVIEEEIEAFAAYPGQSIRK